MSNIPNIPNQKDYKNLTPFDLVLIQKFPFIEEDFDAINLYGIISKIKEKLNDTIANEQIVTENQQALYNYVETYFTNLDVQEEINNKLDEMAESGELQKLLYYNNVQFLFPKNLGMANSGDCTLIKAYDKNILIDTHRATVKDAIEAFLTRNNVSHIDYLILTHYHDDHVGNVINLIDDGFIDNTSYVYLPGYTPLILANTGNSNTLYNDIINKLTNENIPHSTPNEFDTLIIDDFKLTFYNCETSIFNGYTKYNDCSTVCLIEYGNNKALFTGDCENEPFKRFNKLDYFNYKIDFYKIAHHGINYENGDAIHFLRKIIPSIALQSADMLDVINNTISQGTETSFLKNAKCRIFSTYENENDIIFDLSKNVISLNQGKENISQSNRPVQINFHINPNTNNILHLGTTDFPFKDLPEAFSKLQNANPSLRYTLHLVDGEYSIGETTGYASKMTGYIEINIKGNENDNTAVKIKNGIQLFNGVQLKIENCTFLDNAEITSRDSNLIIENCIFDSDEESTSENSKTHIWSSNSKININNNTFKNCNIAISGHYDNIYALNNTFNNCTTAIQNQNGTVQLKSNTYTNVTNKTNLFNNTINNSQNGIFRKEIFKGNVGGTNDIQLTESINKYRFLIFSFGAVSNGDYVNGICLPFSTEGFNRGGTYNVPYTYYTGVEAHIGVLSFTVDSQDDSLLHINYTNKNVRCVFSINLEFMNE